MRQIESPYMHDNQVDIQELDITRKATQQGVIHTIELGEEDKLQ